MSATTKAYGVIAEFDNTAEVLHAAEQVRNEGQARDAGDGG